MSFKITQKILFKHCDPAGIVFYPRYFEMINDSVEALFAEKLLVPFETIVPDAGVPTAQISASFMAPSRHGDVVDIIVTGDRLGKSSLDLSFQFIANDQARLNASATLVYVDGSGRAQGWPDTLRAALNNFIGDSSHDA